MHAFLHELIAEANISSIFTLADRDAGFGADAFDHLADAGRVQRGSRPGDATGG
jgi:hypothetical protein